MIVKGDIANGSDMQAMAESALSEFGRIDVLVTVAGVSGPLETMLWETEEDAFDTVMDANVRGIFLPNKAVMPAMMAQRSGKIVNIGGTYGMRRARFARRLQRIEVGDARPHAQPRAGGGRVQHQRQRRHAGQRLGGRGWSGSCTHAPSGSASPTTT